MTGSPSWECPRGLSTTSVYQTGEACVPEREAACAAFRVWTGLGPGTSASSQGFESAHSLLSGMAFRLSLLSGSCTLQSSLPCGQLLLMQLA